MTWPHKPKHGHAITGQTSKEYRAWQNMRNRCYRPGTPKFANYGGRGIRVCDEWRHSFIAFLAYIGPAPSPKHSLDRINSNGHYEPGNVRWATAKEQAANSRPKHPRTTAHAAAISKGLTGRTYGPQSAERRQRISEALKASWARRKSQETT